MCGFSLVPSLLLIWSGSALKPPIKVSLPWAKKKVSSQTTPEMITLHRVWRKWSECFSRTRGGVCSQLALSSESIYIFIFGWQRGLEFDLSLSFLPLQAENLKVKLNNRMENITSQNILPNAVYTTFLLLSVLSVNIIVAMSPEHDIMGLCEASMQKLSWRFSRNVTS